MVWRCSTVEIFESGYSGFLRYRKRLLSRIERRGVQCRVEEGGKEKEGTNSGLTGSPSIVLNRCVWTQLLGDPIGNCTKTGTFQRQLLATIMVIPITAL